MCALGEVDCVQSVCSDFVACSVWKIEPWYSFRSPTFISDYQAGVESFLNQCWTMIYKAAGWASWRAFLLVSLYLFMLCG